MLRRLFYLSVPRVAGSQVDAIVDTSRSNNARDKITGVLIYTGAFFGQLLEGKDDVVAGLLERLRADSRHTDLHVTFDEQVTERWFAQWSMGFYADDNSSTPFPLLSKSGGTTGNLELRAYVKDLLYRSPIVPP